MKIAIIAAALLTAASAVAAHGNWCSGSGQGPVDCPRDYYAKRHHLKPAPTPAAIDHGAAMRGSGMGPRGYVGARP